MKAGSLSNQIVGRLLLQATIAVAVCAPSARAGLFSEGNILVSLGDPGSDTNLDTLYEYTRSGAPVQSFHIPYPISPIPSAEYARDVAVSPDGFAHVYNGTFSPYVSTLNPVVGTWSHKTHSSWSTVNNGTYGGIAAIDNYVFATDMNTVGATERGVVRFNTQDSSAIRFADNRDMIDLNIGLDGFLYSLNPGGFPEGTGAAVYDPLTLAFIRNVTFNLTPHRAIAVGALGDIFLVDINGNLQKRDPFGSLLSQVNVCGLVSDCRLMDVDISPDGALVMGTVGGRVLLSNSDLSTVQVMPMTFPFGVFVTFVPEPATALLLLSALTFGLRRTRSRAVRLSSLRR